MNQEELKEMGCTWWDLTTTVQNKLQELIPDDKTSWEWEVYKNKDGTWGFDIPYLLTFNEKFVNGTDKCLDKWWSNLTFKKAEPGDKMKMVVSSEELKDATTTCTFAGDDGEGNHTASYYYDTKLDMVIWLCQYLQFLYKCKPDTLWLKLTPV